MGKVKLTAISLSNPSADQAASVQSPKEEVTIEVEETTTYAGRIWGFLSLPQQALSKAAQTMSNSHRHMANCPTVNCTIKVGVLGLWLLTGGGLMIYGIFCLDEGQNDNPSYACTRSGNPSKALMNGGWMVIGGAVTLLGGAKIIDLIRGE